MVLSREGHVYVALLADVLTDQLLLEGIDEGVGADGQRIIVALSAVESLSVHIAVEVDGHQIAVLNGSVLNGHQTGVFISHAADLCVDICVCHICLHLLYLYALVLAQGHFRLYSHNGCVDEILTLFDLGNVHSGAGNDHKSALLCSVRIALVDHFVGRIFKEYACSVHLFDHFKGSFAFSEARDIESAFALIVSILHSCVKFFCRHFDGKLRRILLQLFYL